MLEAKHCGSIYIVVEAFQFCHKTEAGVAALRLT